jgi:putative ABC transport system permease protein
MIQNYLKTAFRNLWLNKPYFFINLFGLALGLTCSILVFIWVQNEMSFDNHHKNAPSLYKLSFEAINQDSTKIRYTISNIAEARSLKQDIPEIVATSAYSPARTLLFKYNDNYFYEQNVRCVDSTFVRMFTFKPIYGDLKTALDDPYSIILTKKMSDKIFGKKNPIGENILVNNLDILKVTAVIEDIPANSNINFKMLIPVNYGIKAGFINERSNINFNYMQLKDGADYVEVNKKMNDFYNAGRPNIFKLHILTPLLEEHLYDFSTSENSKPNIQFVYSFSLIGFFVLIIACLNFMNLSTAQSAKRKKDIGLRKVVGAGRRHIALQYLGESLLISFLALFVALLFVFLLLPLFNNLTNKDFSILYLFQAKTILGLLAITLFTGLFSGSYPALYLSAINPNKVLKGETINSKTRFSIRHVFVILQFSITIFLIVGTVVVYRQLEDYMMHTNMGFNQEQVLYISMKGDSQRKYTKIKGELEKIPELINVTGSRFLPSFIAWNFGFRWIKDGVEQSGITHFNFVDHDWLKTMQIEFVEGRDFSREYASDTAAFIVNQEFLRLIGEQTGVGKRLQINGGGDIIGVVQDFHFKHFRNKIMPLVIWLTPRQNLNHILVRVTPNNISASVKKNRKYLEYNHSRSSFRIWFYRRNIWCIL